MRFGLHSFACTAGLAITLSIFAPPSSAVANSVRFPTRAAMPAFGTMTIANSRRRIERSVMRRNARIAQTIGSSQPVTAEPPVTRPHETPCIVQLFSGVQFVDFSQHLWPYNPPAACPGPWEEVVLDADFNVTAGVQFDRTANIWIAGANVYFGTTAEPSPNLSPSWHVERDVTDLSPILTNASTGQVVLGNIVNSTFNGIISGSAKLEFYPKQGNRQNIDRERDRQLPDAVFPLSAGPLGGAVFLFTPSDQNSTTLTLPRNIERAFLDVYMQSQIGDEFWYSCFPDDLAAQLNNCGHTGFREGEITIDGQPAGVAPVYPWIYSGGIDPFLWFPIPGVETFDFRPYRVDLTPFAGLLSNGQPHTIALSVFNDDNYFATTASLLLFLDHHASQVTGGIISNTTSALPHETIFENVTVSNGVAQGPVNVTSMHLVSIDGFVNTSHGRVETQVVQSIKFANDQQVKVSASEFKQDIVQDTSIVSEVRTRLGQGNDVRRLREVQDWPLTLNFDFVVNADGSATQAASIHQTKIVNGLPPFRSHLANIANANDTLVFPASGGFAPSNPKTSQQFVSSGHGLCFDHTVTAFNNMLTGSLFAGCGR